MNYDDDFKSNSEYSAAPTPQKTMDDNFTASLKLLSTPFNDISSECSLSTSFTERCQSVEGGGGGGRKLEKKNQIKIPIYGRRENFVARLAV